MIELTSLALGTAQQEIRPVELAQGATGYNSNVALLVYF